MHDFRKRRAHRGDLLRTALGALGALALLVLAVICVRAAWGMYGKFSAAAATEEAARQELSSLEAQKAKVSEAVAGASTERGIEAQVRARWGLAHPGEGEIDIVRQAPTTTPAEATPTGFWAKLWHALFVW